MRLILILLIISFHSYSQEGTSGLPLRSYQYKTFDKNGKECYFYNFGNVFNKTTISETCRISIYAKTQKTKINKEKGSKKRRCRLPYRNYYQTDITLLGRFHEGYKTGFWKTTYKKKIVKTENWNAGLILGKYRVYDTIGAIVYTTNFKGQGNGVYKDYYYTTGVLKQEGKYRNGKKDGEWRNYKENGELENTRYYKNGRKSGEWYIKCSGRCRYTHKIISYVEGEDYGRVRFYSGGKLYEEGEGYVYDQQHGIWYYYDWEEKKEYKYIFDKGEIIERYKIVDGKWVPRE